ncbi:putative arabinosyltransferase ARAD1 isoform X2 [Primulina tabacum]
MLPSRLLYFLIAFSVSLLMLSSLSLLELCDDSSIGKSVLQYIVVNNASTYSKPNVRTSLTETLVIKDSASQEVANQVSNPMNNVEELEKYERKLCDKDRARLKVYMYDLPTEFQFGLLGWKGDKNQIWPNVSSENSVPSYSGGLNLQHSTEYWLTLDLLASVTEDVTRPCGAIRVQNSSESEVIFVPFFSSLSYNRHSKNHGKQMVSVDGLLQEQLVEFLEGRKEWKQSSGRDHLIVAHHPNSMLVARKKLGSAMFVLSDFGRYPVEIANLDKDIIAPYKHMVRTVPSVDSATFSERPTLVYFQGAIYRKDGGVIRQELYHLLKDEKDVHFQFGSSQANGIKQASKGMASSKFCLNIAGDTPSSNRLFDAIASHCVPVIISDEIELPFEDILDYSEFCIFARAVDAVKKGYLLSLLRGLTREKWTKMWERLKEVSSHFEYQYPSRPCDAVDMIWQSVYRKKSFTQLNVHRKNKYRLKEILFLDIFSFFIFNILTF